MIIRGIKQNGIVMMSILCYEEMFGMIILIFFWGRGVGVGYTRNFYIVSFLEFMTVMKYSMQSIFLMMSSDVQLGYRLQHLT